MPLNNRRLPALLVCLGIAIGSAHPADGATAADVDTALKKAIAFLYTKQQNGNWETVSTPQVPPQRDSVEGGQWGGLTGVATFALLAAEQDPQDPRIGKAVDFLQQAKMRGVYAVAMRAQVWPLMAKTRNVKQFAQQDMHLLIGGAKSKGPMRGEWFYYVDEPKDEQADHSASQFALLGVWACEEAGVEVPSSFWQTEDALWRRDQLPGGSWPYVYQDPGAWGQPLFSMTLAGLASLYITQEKLVTVASHCNALPADKVIDAGIQYIAKNYPQDWANPPPGTVQLGNRQAYVLFGLSRLGLASGLRYFGEQDWFRNGADYLVKSQLPDGSWGGTWETACSVLFLARGRAPIAINKLQYESKKTPPAQDWNVRPRDVANLAGWMGKALERRINWQVVDIKTNPDDWLDAPILYVAGPDELKISSEQVAKLRLFIESGGMILGNPDCANTKFTASFRKLGQQMFPACEWAELPATHPIYTREQYLRSKWKSKPRVLSLSNGVRELMMLCPDADLGRSFATQSDRSKPEAYQFGADLYEYMVGLDLRRRGDVAFIAPDPTITANQTLKIARLKYNGNWDPEPGGWRRMHAILHNQNKVDLSIQPVDLGSKLEGYAVAHLTGTTPLTLTVAQKTALAGYLHAGGTLLVDSAGGNSDFAASIEPQLASLVPDAMAILPPGASIYQQAGKPMPGFTYTRLSRATMGTLKAPRIKAISINGRPAQLFSSDDLSMGMVGQPVDGIIGYAPDTATEIVRRILLFAANAK